MFINRHRIVINHDTRRVMIFTYTTKGGEFERGDGRIRGKFVA